jgi:MFS family permease
VDRKKLLLFSEAFMAVGSGLLVLNARLAHPQLWVIFGVAGLMSACQGFHRPALEALTPRLIEKNEIPASSALRSIRMTLTMVGGPALGGICIATLGLASAYGLDVLSYLVSLVALAAMRSLGAPAGKQPPSIKSVLEGFKYARSRQELMGTYIVDIVAMVFGMPTALFPAMAEPFGGAAVVGWLYSAPALGAFLAALFSGWSRHVKRHGAAVIVSATLWGVAITLFGLVHSLPLMLLFLVLAGAADEVSALFRSIIWNETIPDHLRGRLAGIEMMSYMSGPLLGNAESGLAAAMVNVEFSVVSGGVLCVAGVLACIPLLPKFWGYRSR